MKVETKVVLNSNLVIPDFPHNIKIRLAPLIFFLLRPDFAILFLYYEECLVSSNWISKLFRFHSAHPNVHTRQVNSQSSQKSCIAFAKPNFFL